MILLHDTAGNEIAVRACDIFVAVRRTGLSQVSRTELSVNMTPTEHVMYTVTETPAEIVAMMRNDAKGWS